MSKLKFIIPAAVIAAAGIIYVGLMLYATREAESQLRHMAEALNAREVEWDSVRPSLFSNSLTVKKLKFIDMDSVLGKATLGMSEFHADNSENTQLTFSGLDILFNDPSQAYGQVKADRMTVADGNLFMTGFNIYQQVGDETPASRIDEVRLTSSRDDQGMRFSIQADHIRDAESDPMVLEALGKRPDDPNWTGSNLVINGWHNQAEQLFLLDLNIVTPELVEVSSSLTLNRIADLNELLAQVAMMSDGGAPFNPANLASLLDIEPNHFSLDINDYSGKTSALLNKIDGMEIQSSEDPVQLCQQDPERVQILKGMENCVAIMKWGTGHNKGFTVDAKAIRPFSVLDAMLSLASGNPDLLLDRIAITVKER